MTETASLHKAHRESLRTTLLFCGVVSSLLYITTDLATASAWTEYRYADQAISELGAIGAPTRSVWIAFSIVYGLLLFGFSWGAWLAAGRERSLRVVAALMFATTSIGAAWQFFPMHSRGLPTSSTDTMHAVFAGVQVAVTLCAIAFSAVALGKRFRAYAIGSIAVMLLAGVATFLSAPALAAHSTTPGIGLLERVNVYGYLLWIAVLAVMLSHRDDEAAPAPRRGIA